MLGDGELQTGYPYDSPCALAGGQYLCWQTGRRQADDEAATATPHMDTPRVDGVMSLMSNRLRCRQRAFLTDEVVRCGGCRRDVHRVERAGGIGVARIVSLRRRFRTPIQ